MEKVITKTNKHGLGVYATCDIDVSELILTFYGDIFLRTELPNPYTADNDYYLQIGKDQFLGSSGRADDYVNHSCDPNSAVIIGNGTVILRAIKKIYCDEEIYFDYSVTNDNFGYILNCQCSSSQCRAKVKDFLQLAPEVQARYLRLGIVPDYILNQVDKITN